MPFSIRKVIVFSRLMPLVLVLSNSAIAEEPLGLVLSGGGAKGAFEVGVWAELVESGLAKSIHAVSGTSVGALNAALFATVQDPGKCTRLWCDEVGELFLFNTNLVCRLYGAEGLSMIDRVYRQMRENIEMDLKLEAKKYGCAIPSLPNDSVVRIRERCESVARKRLFLQLPKLKTLSTMLVDFDDAVAFEGFISSATLHSLIMRELPRRWPRKAPTVYATSLCKKEKSYSAVRFILNEVQPEQRASMICASTCIPVVFGMYEFGGKTFVDGGWESKGGDNVPLEPIIDNHPEIKRVIVVYLNDNENLKGLDANRLAKNREVASAASVDLVEIIPSEDIGGALNGWAGVFDTTPETARRLIGLGRKDAREALTKAGMIKGQATK